MHEASIMQTALEDAERHARAGGCSVIHVLELRLGALSGVVPEALEFAFAALKPGTMAAEGRLEIVRVPARTRCRQCGHEFTLEELVFACPQCDGWESDLLQGRELELARIEAS